MRIVKLSPSRWRFPRLRAPCAIPTACWRSAATSRRRDCWQPTSAASSLVLAGEAILWWSPDPRAVLFPAEFHLNRSLKRFLRHDPFRITLNHDFATVIAACAHRPDEGTWIGPEVQRAYQHLHRLGYAHSVEVWQDDQLVGGMYGVAQGALFCGESMFSRVTNASKCALMAFCRHFAAYGGELIDCQVLNAHTARLGAREIPRRQFLQQLSTLQRRPLASACWAPQVISPQPVEPPSPVN